MQKLIKSGWICIVFIAKSNKTETKTLSYFFLLCIPHRASLLWLLVQWYTVSVVIVIVFKLVLVMVKSPSFQTIFVNPVWRLFLLSFWVCVKHAVLCPIVLLIVFLSNDDHGVGNNPKSWVWSNVLTECNVSLTKGSVWLMQNVFCAIFWCCNIRNNCLECEWVYVHGATCLGMMIFTDIRHFTQLIWMQRVLDDQRKLNLRPLKIIIKTFLV